MEKRARACVYQKKVVPLCPICAERHIYCYGLTENSSTNLLKIMV